MHLARNVSAPICVQALSQISVKNFQKDNFECPVSSPEAHQTFLMKIFYFWKLLWSFSINFFMVTFLSDIVKADLQNFDAVNLIHVKYIRFNFFKLRKKDIGTMNNDVDLSLLLFSRMFS